MARSDRREKKFKDNKEARRMLQTYNKSWKSREEANLVPLDKPVRIGFDRFFVIRPDLLRSPKKTILQSLLPIVNNTKFCRHRKFTEKDWRTGKIRPIEQELNVLDERRFAALTEQQKSYFQLEKRKTKQWHGAIRIDTVFVFKFPWMFEFKIKPSFITHREIPDSELESLRKKLGDKLWTQLFAYKAGIAERGTWWYEDRFKTRDRAIKKIIEDDVREGLGG
jgi:hypothetical protein